MLLFTFHTPIFFILFFLSLFFSSFPFIQNFLQQQEQDDGCFGIIVCNRLEICFSLGSIQPTTPYKKKYYCHLTLRKLSISLSIIVYKWGL